MDAHVVIVKADQQCIVYDKLNLIKGSNGNKKNSQKHFHFQEKLEHAQLWPNFHISFPQNMCGTKQFDHITIVSV